MTARRIASALAVVLPAVLGIGWAWSLLAVPDHLLVLERRVVWQPGGPSLPAALVFTAVPVGILASVLLLARGARRRLGPAAGAGISFVLIGNAVRCLKLHDPLLSFSTAAMAALATLLAMFVWLKRGGLHRFSGRVREALVPGSLILAGGIELVAMLFFVPWSLRGDLPKNWNYHPFGAALRSVLYADLEGYRSPAGRNLRGIRLEGADLRGSVFKAADLRRARLEWARMDRADLEGADLADAALTGARLSFIDLRKADLSRVDLWRAYSFGADLRGAILRGGTPHAFFYADVRGADLSGAKMNFAQIFGCDLRGAALKKTRLQHANMIRVNLDGADCSGADLSCSDMDGATFRGTVLEGADLTHLRRVRPDSLAEARSLRGAMIDPALRSRLERLNPALFK